MNNLKMEILQKTIQAQELHTKYNVHFESGDGYVRVSFYVNVQNKCAAKSFRAWEMNQNMEADLNWISSQLSYFVKWGDLQEPYRREIAEDLIKQGAQDVEDLMEVSRSGLDSKAV